MNRLLPRTVDDPVFWLRVALLFVAEFGIVRGYRYAVEKEPVPMALQLISSGFSVSAFGVLWFIAAVVALVSIPKVWPGGSAPTAILSLLFAFAFTLSWASSWGTPPRGPGAPAGSNPHADYTNASTYWLVLGLLTCGYFLSRRALRGDGVGGASHA